MTRIGIIGAGIAGLHLGLFLRQHGIPATIYAERTPEQTRSGRLPALVVRFAPTRERERMLDVVHWDDPQVGIHVALHLSVGGPHPLAFTGHFAQPASTVDMRIYCAQLLEDFARRGGNVIIGTVRAEELERLAAEYDLVVVSSGRASLTELFPRVPEHSPYTEPQRHLIAGLFRGIADATPPGTSLAISPGHGEVIAVPMLTFSGEQMGLLIEAIPDGALDVLYGMR